MIGVFSLRFYPMNDSSRMGIIEISVTSANQTKILVLSCHVDIYFAPCVGEHTPLDA